MAVSVLCPRALMQKGFAVTDGAAQRQLLGCWPVCTKPLRGGRCRVGHRVDWGLI